MEENTKRKKRGKEKVEWERIMGINRKKEKGKGGEKGGLRESRRQKNGKWGKSAWEVGKGEWSYW
jgi:hypothetical protein